MSAIRALRQLTASSSRSWAARSMVSASRSASWRAAANVNATRAFSVSARRLGEGTCEFLSPSLRCENVAVAVGCISEEWVPDVNVTADVSLSQKLAEELKYETEAAREAVPEFLTNFKQSGVWEVCQLAALSSANSVF